jgi:hypothetical protein
MDRTYKAAQDNIKNTVSDFAAATHTDPDAPAMRLHPESVIINGAPRQNMGMGSFASQIDNAYANGDKRDRLDVVVNFNPLNDNGDASTDLRALQEGQLRKATLVAFQKLLSGIPLKDGNGATVADKIDFSGEPAEASKPYKQQVANLKTLVDKGIAEAGDKLPEEVKALLQHAKTFDTETGSVFGFSTGKPEVTQEHVQVSFDVGKKGEGEISNAAVAHANLNARKEEVLAAVREAAIAAHAANAKSPEELDKFKAELAKLDMQVAMTNNEYGENVTVRFGNKVDTPPDAQEKATGERLVGSTVLAALSEKTLTDIINDSVLLKGKDADKIVHLLAGDNDVERLLERYKNTAPSFEAALKSDIMMDSLPWDERRKQREKTEDTAKIIPSVTVDSSVVDGKLHNDLHIAMDLPKGVTHSDVVRALGGKAVMGPATQREADKVANDTGIDKSVA